MGGVGGDDDGDDGELVAAVWALGNAVSGLNGVGYGVAGLNAVTNVVGAVNNAAAGAAVAGVLVCGPAAR